MKYRRFGKTDWQVSEIGYGMWGMAGWTGSDDRESLASLQKSIDLIREERDPLPISQFIDKVSDGLS